MKTLNLVGAGKVGKTLARLWHEQKQLQIQDVLTSSLQSATQAVAFVGAGRPVKQLTEMRPADLWMLAVPDSQIASCATAMALNLKNHAPSHAFHTSGALASDQLVPLEAIGWKIASAHCILSFADPQSAMQQFPGTVCGIEGHTELTDELDALLTATGAQCFALKSENKLLYHAGAVFATNFIPVLQQTAEALWSASGVPSQYLPQLRERLLHNAVANVIELGPTDALTGPAVRGDMELIGRQAQAVEDWDPSSGRAYRQLSEMALRLAKIKRPQ
jgi:predicted short-subunit dehydrogenase-like oxidoreductase (DUF2520 family)